MISILFKGARSREIEKVEPDQDCNENFHSENESVQDGCYQKQIQAVKQS